MTYSHPIQLHHTKEHESQFYNVPDQTFKKIFQFGGVPDQYLEQMRLFREQAILIRQPALELMGLLERTNFQNPTIRYLIYGHHGTGKSLTMSHLVHYAFCKDWILVHVPWAPYWTRLIKEIVPSVSRPGRLDQPTHAVKFLQRFFVQNEELLTRLNLKVSQTYTWSKREQTSEGSPIVDVIEQGINRPKYSSDCVAVLLKELKLAANESKCKVFMAVDGVNALFLDKTNLKKEDYSYATPSELTLLRAVRNMLNNDWRGGAVVTTVDKWGMRADQRPTASHLPRHLLGKEGWECLDPFYPVEVSNYTEKEFLSTLDYLKEKNWIQHPQALTEEGRDQLAFLSGFNPLQLQYIVDAL
ncbi:hypothetical protein QYM36_017175 [Artemia franciscana]|uniref:Small ribosomal subunit protein mS29 n=1 Tax=Artemia franciscana TaxID=6661 RepID=A0AA88KWN8_ARTSF|nr:hypothetical protein QYM36_017175 [Artemia franciscana]